MDELLEQRVRDFLDAGAWNEAVEAVLVAHRARLRGFIRAVMLDHGAADEVWAETTFDIYRGLGSWDRRRPLVAWCWGVARNACRRYYRDRRRRADVADTQQGPRWTFSGHPSSRTPTPVWQTTPVRSTLDSMRASLTPDERMLLILRVDKQLAWREIADIMHPELTRTPALARREAALRKRFERLLTRLRVLARQHGLLPT